MARNFHDMPYITGHERAQAEAIRLGSRSFQAPSYLPVSAPLQEIQAFRNVELWEHRGG